MKRVLMIGVLFAITTALASCAFGPNTNTPATQPTAQGPAATALPPVGGLRAEARVVPIQSATLSLPVAGVIAELLVDEGQQVEAGQVLVRLDPARSEATVAQATADLARAQAAYKQLHAGATAEEIAMAEATLRAAQAQLKQVTGSITPADRTAVTADIQRARAHLAALQSGTLATDIQAAQAQVAQMQANLQAQRDLLSAAKTNAQLQVERATSELTRAQANYATALQNWQYAEETNRDPITPWLGANSNGEKIPNTLGEAQRQQYYNAYVQAEAALRSTETSVKQAELAYETARQAEISGIQVAEQMVASSQAAFEKLRAGATAEELAAARADLASGQAARERMSGEQRAGLLEAAQATVDQAEAGLEQLRAGASPNALAVATAEVEHAAAALMLAQVTLAETELRAPFAGTIAAIDVKAGEYAILGTPILQLANLSAWQVETTDLTERTVVRVHEGNQTIIRFDALPDLELNGTVRSIKPLGENQQGDITYTAIIALTEQDPRLRWNMTASVIVEEE